MTLLVVGLAVGFFAALAVDAFRQHCISVGLRRAVELQEDRLMRDMDERRMRG